MSEAMFEQAPLQLLTQFTLGDKVTLVTFPVGNPPVSYRLEAKITEADDGNFEGEITKVIPLGREEFSQQHFHAGGHVEFQSGNILGNAP
ncbi:hypothetical protein BS639_18670 [Rouxiella silvae]|uniref:Uncharacterized protein n=1 Tax=Rouxiella silvae TaxID=1646373 RepID=A0AA40X3H0_9GAMM|nr:hypothetical protein [Rouxiella silvae]KQN51603.1 hypothetical protein ASE93_00095 [Serratia sp. Leaf50]MBF6637487.1 hypothetical protein [Rouxiella silvae]ORJ19686.1 hypothetical protein BS639_18670 [Rouxiella silvae]